MNDRRITELSEVEFTGSLGEAFTAYGNALAALATRWHTELGLASVDARKALEKATSTWWGTDPRRKVRAWRVAKRLRRAQNLVSALAESGKRFPRVYSRNFLVLPPATQSARIKAIDTAQDGMEGDNR